MIKKRIMILIDSLKIGGGAEKFISILASRLSQRYNVFILTFNDFKNLYPYKGKYYSLKENKKSISKLFNIFKISILFRSFKVYKYITSFSPNILISAMDYTNIFTIFTKFLFRLKIPLIISVYCNPRLQYKNERRYLNFLIKIFYPSNLVNKIVTISKDVKYILENDYKINEEKLKSIYNGIEIKKIQNLATRKIKDYKEIFENEKLIKFITIGRLVELKGHLQLIEAFHEVKEKIPHAKLIIRGEGPLKEKIEMLICKYNLEKDIIFLGLKRNIYKYLAKSNIFILSSKSEGFPTVLLEALACHLPIISTNCETGPNEILNNGKYGILVKVMDSKDLAEKMFFLANNKELMKEFSLKAKKRKELFNIDETVKEWNDLIEQTLNKIK